VHLSRRNIALVLSLIAAVFFYNRCKKPSPTVLEISGVVLNEQSGNVISGVEVSLKTRSIDSGTFNNNFQTIDSRVTDVSGNFSFEFENISVASIQLTFEKDGLFLREIEISPDDIDIENGISLEVLMNAVAQINLTLKNQFPVDDEDTMQFRYVNASFSCSCCDNSVKIIEGPEIDTTLVCFSPSDILLKYVTIVIKGGFSVLDSGEIVISESVNNYEILY